MQLKLEAVVGTPIMVYISEPPETNTPPAVTIMKKDILVAVGVTKNVKEAPLF